MANKEETFFTVVTTLLKGIGQVMLQESAWTGLFFLAGIFCGSYVMGLAAILAVSMGTLTARLLRYNQDDIDAGIYGFSATLVGIALVLYFQPNTVTWLAIIPGAALATIIQHFFISKKIPAYTFPFILITWIFLFAHHNFHLLSDPQSISDKALINNSLTILPRGFGQVMFQDNIWVGILFFIGIFINRPIAAITAAAGAALSAILAYLLGIPLPDIYMGLLSYNAVLCAITFAGKKNIDIGLVLISVVLSVLITIQMGRMSLPVLTFPFVLASWLTLIVKQALALKTKTYPIDSKE
jgi:urea transporter